MSGDKANERQIGGTHYKKGTGLQHWDLVALFEWDYFQAQIIKYVMRWKDKGGIQDLEKSMHVTAKYIEIIKLRERGSLSIEILREALKELGLEDEARRVIIETLVGERANEITPVAPIRNVPAKSLRLKDCICDLREGIINDACPYHGNPRPAAV